mgnify:FL=1
MKRLIAFALALAVVFGVSFALYKPERIGENTAQQTDDVWVGYFFSPKDFDGKAYAAKTDDGYDFGVPGVPVFVTITPFEPGEPGYEEGSEFNYSVGAAVSDEVVGSGMRVNVDDNGSSYETSGEIALDALGRAELYECYVYRTSAGDYYAECTQANGTNVCYRTPSANLNQTRTISTERSSDWRANGKTKSRSIKVSVSFAAHTAAESVEFVWMDSDKNVLSRAAYAADALPEMLAAPEHAALLVTAMQSVDGTSARTLCTQDDLFARAYVPSTLSGLLRVVDVSLDWGEDET